VTTWRALLVYPIAPRRAAGALEARWAAVTAVPLPAVAAWAYFMSRGCRAADATAAGAGLLALLSASALGGALAWRQASRLFGEKTPWRRILPVSAATAAWAPALLAGVAWAAAELGSGPGAPWLGAVVALFWGVACIAGAMSGEGGGDAGRTLVVACGAASGALAGLVLAAVLVRAHLVAAQPFAPAAGEVGRSERRAVLLRPGAGGGKVFFRFGGAWGGTSTDGRLGE